MASKSSDSAPKTTRRPRRRLTTAEGETAAEAVGQDEPITFAEAPPNAADEPPVEAEPAPRRRRRTAASAAAPVESEATESFAEVRPAPAPEPAYHDASPKDAPPADDFGFGLEESQGSGGGYDEGTRADGESGGWQPRTGQSGDEGEGQLPGRKRRRRRRRSRGQEGGGGYQQQGGGPPQRGPQQRPQRGPQQQRFAPGPRPGRDRIQQNRPHRQGPPGGGEEVVGPVDGVLEMHPKGYGFLRDASRDYFAQDSDPFVSSSLIEKFSLRAGVRIVGEVGSGARGQGPRLKTIATIDGRTPEEHEHVKPFDQLTAINPFEMIRLETGPRPVTMRVMDLLTPIGKGQRALLVAPPRTGKTMLLQEIAHAVSVNHPEVHLIVLLIDERPEEVTEMRRKVRGEVIASSLDREVESHVRISQLIVERGKRLAESGKDVFILLDSITRTARAFNKWTNTGRTGSGGLDVRALDIPKKLFGTARRFEEGGSLTVVGTALIETGNRMDEAIFQEFKGTGNMELVLSRDLADRRIWPAIDITKSGTRREELLLSPDTLEAVTLLRRSLISLSPVEAMEQLIKTLERFPSNKEFLARVRSIL